MADKKIKMPPKPTITESLVRFIDGNKSNCRADNLMWCTKKQVDENPDWVTDLDLYEYRFVRFLDGDKSNRKAKNLRWCNAMEIDENPEWVTEEFC